MKQPLVEAGVIMHLRNSTARSALDGEGGFPLGSLGRWGEEVRLDRLIGSLSLTKIQSEGGTP